MIGLVETKQGSIRGEYKKEKDVLIFRGVPYAQPPVGDLRFKRPQAHDSWEGIRPCLEFSSRCYQADLTSMDFYGKEFYDEMVPSCSEDCLYLNIWAPAKKADHPYPVLLWIHGGAFLHGCGSEKEFDGEAFAQNGVILVTINYRVNVFGFFAHPQLEKETAEGVSGNYGILDQLFAINWVRENIAAFGGDPEKITIAGQSAGCMSVQTLISSSLTKGLIRGAILQSGGGIRALRDTPSKETLWETSQKLMDHLQVSAIEQLRDVPAEILCQAAYAVLGEDGLSWRPHVDGWLLEDTTDNLAEQGKILPISYMIGSTGNDIGEGKLLQESGARWCENQLRLERTPAYFYFFDRNLPGDQAGSFHSCELWYEFSTQDRCWRPWQPWDRELSRAISGYWANFVKTGDPNAPDLPLWRPYAGSCTVPLTFGNDAIFQK